MWYGDYWDDVEPRTMTVIDRGLMRPVGFMWFSKPKETKKEIKSRGKRKSKRKSKRK